MTGLARRVGVIAVVVAISAAGCGLGSAGDLKVGECFDDPGEVAEVSNVQRHSCDEAHTGEVFFVSEMTGDNGSYPTNDAFLEHVGTNCVPAFEAYTGTTFDDTTAMDIGYFHPTSEGWGDGDRDVICYVYNLDGSTSTGSVKAGAQ